MYKVRENMMIVFCSFCFRCPAVCSVLCPTSATLNASQTYAYARHAHDCLRGRIFLCAGTCALEPFGAAFCFLCFTFLLFVCLLFFAFNCFLFVFLAVQLLRGCLCFLPFCPFTDSNCFRVCVQAAAICHFAVVVVTCLSFSSALR
ncbi:putative mucin-associated surface protein (MASP) [Trypanosoma cruzi Dm28c]|uniref:Putative mucin-associated surface protein (MASP) n=1 Tax=Trypanosoma cruzi Dm28c TaxID=1416333 RepID=V5AN12_TRYCR|nr:putative mucin-associated surface protein (MASP) [Trypanosoma cruzi Dm28c]